MANPFHTDSDLDGISDAEEVLNYRTNPISPDSDGDGMPDAWEIQFGLDPTIAAPIWIPIRTDSQISPNAN